LKLAQIRTSDNCTLLCINRGNFYHKGANVYTGIHGKQGRRGATGDTGATGSTGATGVEIQRRVAREARGCPGKLMQVNRTQRHQ